MIANMPNLLEEAVGAPSRAHPSARFGKLTGNIWLLISYIASAELRAVTSCCYLVGFAPGVPHFA
jgi:hypothetical protein